MSVVDPLPTEPTLEGEQILVPGIAPVGLCDCLALRMPAKLGSRKPQKPLNIGLGACARHGEARTRGRGRPPPACLVLTTAKERRHGPHAR
jgi:hypothetical protein